MVLKQERLFQASDVRLLSGQDNFDATVQGRALSRSRRSQESEKESEAEHDGKKSRRRNCETTMDRGHAREVMSRPSGVFHGGTLERLVANRTA